MNQAMKILVLAVVLLYIVSPIDLMVGPIDDIIVALLGLVANKRLSAKRNY